MIINMTRVSLIFISNNILLRLQMSMIKFIIIYNYGYLIINYLLLIKIVDWL